MLLSSFHKKDTGFFFMDTHAGIGVYNLTYSEARRTQEYKNGIAKLMAFPDKLHPIIADYLAMVRGLQNNQSLKYYPGSPLIAQHYMREQDSMVLNELHPEDFQTLETNFGSLDHVALHQRDAYEILPALVPLKGPIKNYGRGLILIDPPFEKKSEMNDLTAALKTTLARFAHGVYLIWLPITDKQHRLIIPQNLRKIIPNDKHLYIEFTINNPQTTGLLGCGLIVINPPWQFEKSLPSVLDSLWKVLQLDEDSSWRLFK
jgi:23S rRNA (adenine2030-N6)-methyltransferase